jgi:phosphatidate cytidylyltransferase
MLRTRLIVVIILLPIFIFLVGVGGVVYTGFISLVIGAAAWEFWRMFKKGGYFPSAVGTIGGAVLLILRNYFDFISFELVLTILVMVIMTMQLLAYDRGRKEAVVGFCVSIAGMLYWGLMGGYLIKIRMLPDGFWWFMLVLPATWAADLGGYFGGHWFGKHPMTRRLSPRKTWEGYIGGIILSLVSTALLGLLWHQQAQAITWQIGLILGGLISILSPLGDLGASMFKRLFNLKDASKLIPGHGGVMDRIDSWVWAAALGYIFIIAFV